MHVHIVAKSAHQIAAAEALQTGLVRHGHRVTRGIEAVPCDILAIWGWRRGRNLSEAGHRVLVMERAYVGDRFSWTSFGWDGLNGNARFHIEQDGGERWRRHFEGMLKPQKTGGHLAVIMGQVPGDASLRGADMGLNAWYDQIAARMRQAGLEVVFRDHPQHRGARWATHIPRIGGTLEDALKQAAVVAAWNSNSLVDARLAGVSILAGNPGTMAWAVSDKIADNWFPSVRDLRKWTHDLAWTQWQLPEVASGEAIPHILAGARAPRFHEIGVLACC